MLLLRDLALFLLSASVEPCPRSRVALSLSIALVDLRARRLDCRVVSPAMAGFDGLRRKRHVLDVKQDYIVMSVWL